MVIHAVIYQICQCVKVTYTPCGKSVRFPFTSQVNHNFWHSLDLLSFPAEHQPPFWSRAQALCPINSQHPHTFSREMKLAVYKEYSSKETLWLKTLIPHDSSQSGIFTNALTQLFSQIFFCKMTSLIAHCQNPNKLIPYNNLTKKNGPKETATRIK